MSKAERVKFKKLQSLLMRLGANTCKIIIIFFYFFRFDEEAKHVLGRTTGKAGFGVYPLGGSANGLTK